MHSAPVAAQSSVGASAMLTAAPGVGVTVMSQARVQWSADSLGRSEVEEVAEGFSYGANTIRDGVSLTPKRELRALALASEIMRLENLSGYLRFPGPLPVATVRLDYVYRAKAAERCVPRDDAEGDEKDDGREDGLKAEPPPALPKPRDGGPDAGSPEAEMPDPQGELEFWSQGCDDDSCDDSGSNDPGSEPTPAAPGAAESEVRGDKAAARGDADPETDEDDRAGSRPGIAI